MTSLYQLTGERLALQQKLKAMGMDEQTIEDTLEGDSDAINAKVENYLFVIRDMEADAEAIDTEVRRLAARYDSLMKKISQIKGFLKVSLETCSIKEIDYALFSVSVVPNPPAVEILDERLIPSVYMRIPEPKPVIPAPDKKLIGADLKEGKEVPGAALKTSTRLVIK
jgi:hypothetical protein